MALPASQIYLTDIPSLREKLYNAIQSGLNKREYTKQTQLFFRADDIGVISHQFQLLMNLFIKHRMPLGLAVVPTWLTVPRKDALSEIIDIKSSQWCWHQHGWLHKNHELIGKKQEFGPTRSKSSIKLDLAHGKKRLEDTLGDSFLPFFTPPWNRCSDATLSSLVELQFKGLSRSLGAKPHPPSQLTEIPINVDLHTRKGQDPKKSLKNLFHELSASIATGRCGIMIHHQRMNSRAFHLLDLLLTIIDEENSLLPVHFTDMIQPHNV